MRRERVRESEVRERGGRALDRGREGIGRG